MCTPLTIGMSGERAAQLTLDNVTVGDDAVLGEAGQGDEILEWLEQRANMGHCALQVGVTEEAMKRTAAFVSERKQFGVALGTFQALAMRMADSYIDVEGIRSTYWLAMWRLSEGLAARQRCVLPSGGPAMQRTVWSAQRSICTVVWGRMSSTRYTVSICWPSRSVIPWAMPPAAGATRSTRWPSDDTLGFRALEV